MLTFWRGVRTSDWIDWGGDTRRKESLNGREDGDDDVQGGVC